MSYVAEEIQHSIISLGEAQRKTIVLSLSTVLPGFQQGESTLWTMTTLALEAQQMRACKYECLYLGDIFFTV